MHDEARKRSIINITSISRGDRGGHPIVYCASNTGIPSLTRSLAISFPPEVQVNDLSLGGIEATRWSVGQEEFNGLGRRQAPMKRLASVEDIAGVVMFQHFVTGRTSSSMAATSSITEGKGV
jgi:3-oxoacyl-[acyl-carrier protein] reductase